MVLFVAVITPIYYLVDDNKIPLMISSISEKISFNQNDSILDETVKIKTTNPSANEILAECGNEEHCTVEALQKLAQSESPKMIMATVDDLLSSYHEQGIYCHHQAHHIGEFLYGYFGDLSQVLSNVDRRCGGAVYHGILETYFESEVLLNEVSINDIDISGLCSKIESLSYGLLLECAHGLGHGLLKAHNFDYFSALKHCDQLELVTVQSGCYEGVSMENVTEYLKNKGGDFNENDILHPCNKLEDKYASACYDYQVNYILAQNNSVLDGFKVCEKIESESLIKNCYNGFARALSALFNDDLKKMLSLCQIEPQEYQIDCIIIMEGFLMDHKSTDEGLEFCKIVPEKFKMDCYDALGNGLLLFYPKDVANVCSNAEENYYDVCMNGIPQKFNCSITYELDGKSITESQECLLI